MSIKRTYMIKLKKSDRGKVGSMYKISTRKPLFLHSSYTCEGANSKKRDSCCFFAVGSTKCVFTVCEKRIVGIPESHSHFPDTKEVYLSIRFGLYS